MVSGHLFSNAIMAHLVP